MKKTIRGTLLFLVILSLFTSLALHIFAGTVTYDGNAKKFLYGYESHHSPADLFDNFKNVMPGDRLTQTITVRNDAANGVKVKVYIRSLGAKEESKDFLSQLHMTVAHTAENSMAYMFDAAADQTAGLTDWVLLGTLYSGGEVNLDLTLDVPLGLSNEYENAIGYIDWQFKVEEFPVEDTDPTAPQTGDSTNVLLLISLMSIVSILFVLLLPRLSESRKNR